MLLQYHDLTVRNVTPEDAPQLSLWWNDGRVMAHAGFPLGINETVESIADNLRLDNEQHRRLMVLLSERPIGEMCYRMVDDKTAEIGIKICDFSQQNKGYGKILLSLLIRALFDDMGCVRIVLDTNLTNLRAQHVYERLGFERQGMQGLLAGSAGQSAVCRGLQPDARSLCQLYRVKAAAYSRIRIILSRIRKMSLFALDKGCTSW